MLVSTAAALGFSRAYISYLFLRSVFVPRTNLELSYSVCTERWGINASICSLNYLEVVNETIAAERLERSSAMKSSISTGHLIRSVIRT
jgi:hypothetical protein